MFRRFAATLLAVLVLAVISASPAVAKPDKKDGSAPVATGQEPTTGDGGSTATGGSDAGTGAADNGSGDGDDSAKGPDKGTRTDKGTDTSDKKKSASPSPRPSHSPSTSSSSGETGSLTPASPDSSVVRAAPAVTNTDVTALLPAPDPMLLPDASNSTSVAAPADVERSSSLPQAVPALLIGAGLLSVAVFGTLFARRRIARPRA